MASQHLLNNILIIISIIILGYISIKMYKYYEHFAASYDYSADVNSAFDRDLDARRAEQAEIIKRENITQLVGNLFINNTEEVRKRMTAPDIEYLPRKQTIFDYSDIVL